VDELGMAKADTMKVSTLQAFSGCKGLFSEDCNRGIVGPER
jgi:hypothetical protein